jgi:hypothetical protein
MCVIRKKYNHNRIDVRTCTVHAYGCETIVPIEDLDATIDTYRGPLSFFPVSKDSNQLIQGLQLGLIARNKASC